MPELPEVQTVVDGIKSYLEGRVIQKVVVRQHQLRWPIDVNLAHELVGLHIDKVWRRAKYLIFCLGEGTLLIHLGMSGRLQIVSDNAPLKKHDHVDLHFSSDKILRYTDPRRFGAMLWTKAPLHQHPLLKMLGPEPLGPEFTPNYLYHRLQGRAAAIKCLLMNAQIVVGVGNIYAAEALFQARIHPAKPANLVTKEQCSHLVLAVQKVLMAAIAKGGTTLKDFINGEGNPGYFTQQLQVYGRAGMPCFQCKYTLSNMKLGQRSTVFCPHCQPA